MQQGFQQLTLSDLKVLDTTQQTELGVIGSTGDGRLFRYVGFGGTSTINSGALVVTPAAPANSTSLALSSTNTAAQLLAGSQSVVLVNGSTAVTQDEFRDGYLDVNGPDGFATYRIAGNTAAAASAAITVQLYSTDSLRNATTLVVGTSTANLRVGPYRGVVTSLTASNPVGVTAVSVPNTASQAYFGWVQVVGPISVQATSATKGDAVVQDTSTSAGAIANDAAATSSVIGVAIESAVAGAAQVALNIY